MKILHFTLSEEEGLTINQMVKTQLPKNELIESYSFDQCLLTITQDGPFFFYIFDADHKTMMFNDFLNQIEDLSGKKPIIVVGSTNSIKGQVTSKHLNDPSIAVLEKPITLTDFKKAVKQCIEWGKNEEFEQSISEFTKDDLHPMKIRNFYLFEQLPYDVYLELTSTKFGKIISKNKTYSHQIIHSYAKKNIKHLYLKKDDYLKFLDQSIKNLIKMYDGKLSDRKKYISLHLRTAFFMHQYIKILNVSEDINILMKKYIDSVTHQCRNYETLTQILDDFPTSNQLTFAYQTVYSSYLCMYILQNLGWHADMSKDKLLLACMLQDVTLSSEDLIKIRSLNDPNLKMFSEEEQIEFREHPRQAALISNYFSGFTEVDFIISEHHEHPNGDGFPKGLNSSSLTTISCIMILATSFSSRLSLSHNGPGRFIEILGQIKRIYNSGNFKGPLKALEKALKV